MMMKMKSIAMVTTLLLGGLTAQAVQAAIALDRTRVIFNGAEKSMTVNIENKNKSLPYLAQAWLEDTKGNKISSPITALPPIQRVEPAAKSQVKLQGIESALHTLPQDQESLFYFNLREIPPKSKKPNTLQLALQTRIKLFYRPAAIATSSSDTPFQEKIKLTRSGSGYIVNNPTPYYITVINATRKASEVGSASFKPLMVPPKGKMPLGVGESQIGNAPVLTYINDFGGRPRIIFKCNGTQCQVSDRIKG